MLGILRRKGITEEEKYVEKQIKRVEELSQYSIWQELAEMSIKKLPEEKRQIYEKKLEDAKYRGSKRKLEEIIENAKRDNVSFSALRLGENLLRNIPESERRHYQTKLNKVKLDLYLWEIGKGCLNLVEEARQIIGNVPDLEEEMKYEGELYMAISEGRKAYEENRREALVKSCFPNAP